jgi:hypothetical protein
MFLSTQMITINVKKNVIIRPHDNTECLGVIIQPDDNIRCHRHLLVLYDHTDVIIWPNNNIAVDIRCCHQAG